MGGDVCLSLRQMGGKRDILGQEPVLMADAQVHTPLYERERYFLLLHCCDHYTGSYLFVVSSISLLSMLLMID